MKVQQGPDTRVVILRNLTEASRVFYWVSSLSVAGLLGAAGFVLALKDGRFRGFRSLGLFSGKEDAEDDSFLVPGLQNLGNNCFLNVILQALASCKDFRVFLQRVIEDSEESVAGEVDEDLPLTYALLALLEELCTVVRGRAVSSPRKVMLALAHYVQNFDLTNQQDAGEAFFHLMSSLQEELTNCYIPCQRTLSDVIASLNLRILAPKGSHGLSELKRWQEHVLGPFDGILGSVLMCQTCSSQISLELQFFHTLPLSPVLDSGSNIMYGCALEDCLKKFFVAEKVENYCCSKCWHGAALKYLSVTRAAETDIEKLRSCAGQDLCDCKSALRLETLPWSNNFSHTLKQLSIARCPKLLCIQVQRASINMFGESVKLRGHVAFPVVLDLSRFTTSAIGMNPEESTGRGQKSRPQKPIFRLDGSKKFGAGSVLNLLRPTEQQILLESVTGSANAASSPAPPDPKQSKFPYSESHLSEKVLEQSSSNRSLYRLVTVVEHFGKTGGGHYIVYRSVKQDSPEQKEDVHDHHSDSFSWFSISDSEVAGVLESDVLGAEASLLFYERL